MFTTTEREKVRTSLIQAAQKDDRITGGALTGSASVGKEDRWSDIDLAFGVRAGVDKYAPLESFTKMMYRKHGALHHLDVFSSEWIYRAFLLDNTLQVDLAFVSEEGFRPTARTFKLLFGKAVFDGLLVGYPDSDKMIGMAWLYALHVRSCIKRNNVWQAEHMISGMRNEVLKLACLRHKLPVMHGRGYDQLPSKVTRPLESSLVKSLSPKDMKSAFRATTNALVREIRYVDGKLAEKLERALRALTR